MSLFPKNKKKEKRKILSITTKLFILFNILKIKSEGTVLKTLVFSYYLNVIIKNNYINI